MKHLMVCVLLTNLTYGIPSVMGALVLDTGTPNESRNLSVFAAPGLPGAQFLAQEFSLTSTTHVTDIAAYIGGASGHFITMDIASAIGTTATSTDLIASYNLAMPGTWPHEGEFVSATVNHTFLAGTYFLVFSAGTTDGWMPVNAPNTIGNRFSVADRSFPFMSVNTVLPIASNFEPHPHYQPGIQIYGNVIPAPGAITLGLIGMVSLSGFHRRRKQSTAV